jgi:hypothetical protein
LRWETRPAYIHFFFPRIFPDVKQLRFRLRIFLIAFAFGLLLTSIFARIQGYLDEVPVDLPKTKSGETMIVFPESERNPLIHGGGGGGGITFEPPVLQGSAG